MALSSDEVIKREILDTIGSKVGELKLRIFPESSNEDQKRFEDGGLTFTHQGVDYGSCDACWYVEDKDTIKPIVALEGTDALNRKSSGNAQYQRFHHALGAVKRGIMGVYYLKKGVEKIQPDLYGMSYFASQKEAGVYLIIDDLNVLKQLLLLYPKTQEYDAFIRDYLKKMYGFFKAKFDAQYKANWEIFAKKRSTIIKKDYVIKHAGRMRRNFTDASQRAGHIAVGEMYLTKYYFYNKKLYYLFPKMTQADLNYLDKHKLNDKEWYLLRNEPNVEIKTIDDIKEVPKKIRDILYSIRDKPLKGDALQIYNFCVNTICDGLRKNQITIT